MPLIFWLNNIHFSLELFGALIFIIVAWLAFDSLSARKNLIIVSRGMGFVFLAVWQIIHALDVSSDITIYIGYGILLIGFVLVLWNLAKEALLQKPKYSAVFVFANFASLASLLGIISTIGLALIAGLSFYQYKNETKKSLIPFILGFGFLSLGALFSIFYKENIFGVLWIIGHLWEVVGFVSIGWWVWSYLQLRIREQMLLILVSMTMILGIIISLSFSSILVKQIEDTTARNLEGNVKVLDFAISTLKEEAGAKSAIIASEGELQSALNKNDFVQLQKIATQYLENEKLGLLTILNENGEVVLRAHALTQREDNLSNEKAVQSALKGQSSVSIEPSIGDGFSIRAASPLFLSNNKLVGVLVAGYQLDNAFADSTKNITGLDFSIFDNKKVVATTVFNQDGVTRSVDIDETNKEVLDSIFSQKKPVTLRTTVFANSFLASYLPIVDNGEVVGMLSSMKAEREILDTANEINRFTLIVVLIITSILIIPLYFITKRLEEQLA